MESSSSSLKLTIEKGPRAGETLEFSSKAVVKIGRFVRGNTISIKDAGISTKHLSIQFDSAAANWILLDLDSSNGTILNSVDIVPLQPTVIRDGDTIKIGEYTSIVVGIGIGEIGASELRRNPRRGRKGGEVDKVRVGVGDSGKLGLGLGSREDSEDSVVEVAPPVKRNLRGRPPKGVASLQNEGAEVRVSTRRMRNSKKEEEVLESLNVDASDRKEPKILVRKGRGGGKGRRNLLDEEVDNGGMDENLGGYGCGGSEEMAAAGEGLLNVSLEGGGVDVREETRVTNELNSVKMAAVDGSLPDGSSGVGVDGREGKRVDNDVNSGERGSKWLRKDVLLEPDLAKLALGDWFDYLEAYLSKTIYDETEAMISSMKEQAAKVHELRLQHEKMLDTRKGPIE